MELRKLASRYIDMYLFEAHESRLVFLLELWSLDDLENPRGYALKRPLKYIELFLLLDDPKLTCTLDVKVVDIFMISM